MIIYIINKYDNVEDYLKTISVLYSITLIALGLQLSNEQAVRIYIDLCMRDILK